MLGQEAPVRDIPERDGYDRIRLAIESAGWPPLTLDRSIEGGDFRAYEELLMDGSTQTEAMMTLRWKHNATRQDTLSYALLKRTALTMKVLRKNAPGPGGRLPDYFDCLSAGEGSILSISGVCRQ